LPFVLAASLSSPAAAQTAEAMRARAEQLHDAPATAIAGVRLTRPDAVAHFFQARGFRPAWTIPAASDEILKAIRARARRRSTCWSRRSPPRRPRRRSTG
jgi:hypothetical protein